MEKMKFAHPFALEGLNLEDYMTVVLPEVPPEGEEAEPAAQFLPTAIRVFWHAMYCASKGIHQVITEEVKPFELGAGQRMIQATCVITWDDKVVSQAVCVRPLLSSMPPEYYNSVVQAISTSAKNRGLLNLGFYLPQETMPADDLPNTPPAEPTQIPTAPAAPSVTAPSWAADKAKTLEDAAPEVPEAPKAPADPLLGMTPEEKINWAKAQPVSFGRFKKMGWTLGELVAAPASPELNDKTGEEWTKFFADLVGNGNFQKKLPHLWAAANILLGNSEETK